MWILLEMVRYSLIVAEFFSTPLLFSVEVAAPAESVPTDLERMALAGKILDRWEQEPNRLELKEWMHLRAIA